MKAAVWVGINKVEIQEVPIPVPGASEVLVHVKSAGICATDIHVIKGLFSHSNPPQILGHEIAGEIVELGASTSNWKVGDRVVIDTLLYCGECYYCRKGMQNLCIHGGEIGASPNQGGYAEYLTVPQKCLKKLPDSISFDEAGIMESLICPAGSIFRLGLQFGETVLIQGAGPAGLSYIQIAKACGAGKIIVSARNPVRLKQALKFGADVIINIENEDIEKRLLEETEGRGADVSIEAAGTPTSIAYATKLAARNGRVILYGIPEEAQKIQFPVIDIILRQLSVYGACSNSHVWEPVIRLVEKGDINLKDMVTHTFPLEKINEAITFVDSRRDGVIKAVLHP